MATWLDEAKADADLRATATGLRGFFLADPEELSLIALVDQFAESDDSGAGRDCTASRAATTGCRRRSPTPLGERLHLNTDVVALSHRGKVVRVSVKNNRALAQINCDYAILALPATLLRRIPITPALPAQQHEAIVPPEVRPRHQDAAAVLEAVLARARTAARVRLAAAVRRRLGRQRRAARPRRHPVVCWPAAAPATRPRPSSPSTARAAWPTRSTGSARRTASSLASRQIVWEQDPYARGGYAYFDPGFDPSLRAWLSRPAGRLFFAGEHTSVRWQGYMNGAVESGRRAAAEVAAVHTAPAVA